MKEMTSLPLLALLCALLAGPARADLITPDMVNLPYQAHVTDQYESFGLVFHGDRDEDATHVDGGWKSLYPAGEYAVNGAYQTVSFVTPGTGQPAATDVLRVRITSAFNSLFWLDAYYVNGSLLRSFYMVT